MVLPIGSRNSKRPAALVEIRKSAFALAERMKNHHDFRVQRIRRQVQAIVARVDFLLGARMSFDQETEAYFGLALPSPQDSMAEARSNLNRMLGRERNSRRTICGARREVHDPAGPPGRRDGAGHSRLP